MKSKPWIVLLIVLPMLMASGQEQRVVSMKYPGYTLSVPGSLQDSPDAGLVPLVAGKVDSLPKKAADSRFGILYRDDAKNLAGTTFLEIVNTATNTVIRKVSLDEYFNGKENNPGFSKEIVLADDEALPGGKKLEVSFYLQSTEALKVKTRLYGKVEGLLTQTANGFVITNTEPLSSLKPALLFQVIHGMPAQMEISKKGKQQSFVLTGSSVTLEPNRRGKILSLDIAGTTVSFAKYVPQQIENLRNYYAGKKTAPNVAVIAMSEKPKTAPGDTMTYFIYYHNIGTAPAQDINLTGAIPAGTIFLEGSAKAMIQGVEVGYDRKQAKPPVQGDVLKVTWNDKTKINAGEERWVQYKVVVQ